MNRTKNEIEQVNNYQTNYKVFMGDNESSPGVNGQMPYLIDEGRIPLSVYDLIRRKVDSCPIETDYKNLNHLKKKNLNNFWWDVGIATGDGMIYHQDGKAKIVLDAKHIRELNDDIELEEDYGIALSDEIYRQLDGEEFTKEELKKYERYDYDNPLTKEEIKENPIWRILVRGDSALLNEFVNINFYKGREDYGIKNLMSIVASHPRFEFTKVPSMHIWSISSMELGSSAFCVGGVEEDAGTLVGMFPPGIR